MKAAPVQLLMSFVVVEIFTESTEKLHVIINMYTSWGVGMSHPTGDGYAQASLDRQHTMERRYYHHPRIEYWPLLVEGTEEISRMASQTPR
jgi:hypothetical protein